VIVRHVLPHTLTQAVVLLASDVIVVIVAVTTLGYLGLGVQPPTPDWGSMISENRAFVTRCGGCPRCPVRRGHHRDRVRAAGRRHSRRMEVRR